MKAVLDRITREGVWCRYAYAGPAHRTDSHGRSRVYPSFEITLTRGERTLRMTHLLADGIAEGVNDPEVPYPYPCVSRERLEHAVWASLLRQAGADMPKARSEHTDTTRALLSLLGEDTLADLTSLYRHARTKELQAAAPERHRYRHENGHCLGDTGRQRDNGQRGGTAALFRCVGCKRVAQVHQFREENCRPPLFPNPEIRDDYRQMVLHFAERVNANGSAPFACWTRDDTQIHLYTAEGVLIDSVSLPGPADLPLDDLLAVAIDAWGPLSSVLFSDRVYGKDR